MAKVSFDTAVSSMNNEGNSNGNSVGFLSLKNDGDEAIVRIMHNSVADFDIVTLHPITLGGKFRTVSCVRDPRDPMDNCPLCKNGTKVQSKIFIHMIQYVTNEQGQIEAKPVVWERPMGYATKLKSDIDEYGPLSECIFKVKRHGKAGDKNTTYEMKLGNPNMYNEASYPKLDNAFENYSACGTVVLDKSYEEIAEFVATGQFPETAKNTNNESAAPTAPAVETPRGNWQGNSAPQSYATAAPSNAPAARPTRYY